MLFHKQTIMHDPDNGKYGDCGRTAVACMLELPVEDVPHFFDGTMTNSESYAFYRDFLSQNGIELFTLPLKDISFHDLMKTMENFNKSCTYLLIGKSPRGHNHIVICRGGKIIHDPHPDEGEFVGPCEDGFWWLEVFSKKC